MRSSLTQLNVDADITFIVTPLAVIVIGVVIGSIVCEFIKFALNL
jgi:hypothetical protein